MNNQEIIENIKSAFCNLTSFKVRQNALEVITAYSTINSKFVSVFITFTNNKIVVTDSGWIHQNYYDTPIYSESENIIKRVTDSFQSSFNIKSTVDKEGINFFYKTCDTIEQIPSVVFDLASFIVAVVNAFCIQYKDEKEEKERETFRNDANNYLSANYTDKVKLRSALNDFPSIKFNALININSSLHLVTYVTGSTQTYFENDLRKSIVSFEFAAKSKYRDFIKERIAIINDKSDGYVPNKSALFFELLSEKTTRDPVRWTEKERILDFI